MSRTKVGKVPPMEDLKGIAFEGVEFSAAQQPFGQLFSEEKPLVVDIGCGKGLVLTEQPLGQDYNYLGIEKREKYVCFVGERIQKMALANARIINGFVEPLLETEAVKGSIDVCSILFPDPWHKKRHRKRRVINDQGSILSLLARAMKPAGQLWVVTDHREYFESMQAVLDQSEQFVPDPENLPPSALTHFEIKYTRQQKPIYRASYKLRSA
jgi:tRNA (guanine-N7-)-methyltransferase